jgi:hypothetical protein
VLLITVRNSFLPLFPTMMRFIVILLALSVATIQGFTCAAGPQQRHNQDTALFSLSRSKFLTAASSSAAAMLTIVASPASVRAAEDAAKKGTKDDPAYQFCLSTCMYECTKPKGEETKLRKECLPECKQKCATTKQQLMIGTPVGK